MTGPRLSGTVELDLGRLYESNLERTRFTIDFYKDLYGLPTFVHTDDVSPELFAYCQRRNFFVNILAYTGERIFLRRGLGASLQWELPGSGVQSKGDETVEDAAFRIIGRDIPNIDIGELRPIAHIEKKYRCSGREVTHVGLTFMGRVRNLTPEDIAKEEDIKGRFIPINDNIEVDRISGVDRDIFKRATSLLHTQEDISSESVDDEIESTRRISPVARVIHNRLVGPIGRYLSSRKIKAKILQYVTPKDYFLDVACGDDEFILQVAGKAAFCVGNDIQWGQIRHLMEVAARPFSSEGSHRNLLFTNHDACQLPFHRKFDLTLCKNLLHHMDSKDQLLALLSSLGSVSRRILIVDPEDPTAGPWNARFWHSYYVHVLKDQGERFFTFGKFKQLLEEYYKDARELAFDKVVTVKGVFMVCHVALATPDAQ